MVVALGDCRTGVLREPLHVGKRNQVGVVVQAQLCGGAVIVNVHAVNAALRRQQVLQTHDALVTFVFDLR